MIQKYKSMGVESKAEINILMVIGFMIIVPILSGLAGVVLLSQISLVLGFLLFMLVSHREQKKLTAFYSQRNATEAADEISARIAQEKIDGEKKFVELWDDAFEWMTAFDSYNFYSSKPLIHFGCQGRDCTQESELCRKCSNSVDFIVVSSNQAWVQALQKRAEIEKKYVNAGSGYVGIPIPWEGQNENTKQLVR